jgi:predicted nucleic acid-binding Zn ribbon protein
MSDNELAFRSCLTCGKMMPLQGTSKQVYCSPECSRENLRCPVCGRYYEKGTGTVPEGGGEVCSSDCARVERRFDSVFKELS